MLHEVLLSPSEFVALPLMNRHGLRRGRQIIPQVFHQLKLFRGGEVENGRNHTAHVTISEDSCCELSYFAARRPVNLIFATAGHARNSPGNIPQQGSPGERRAASLPRQIPDQHRPIDAARGEALAIRAESEALYPAAMPGE